MKWLFSITLLVSSFSAFAEVSPEHVESMLQQMVRENVISAVEAEKAKVRLRSMGADQWTALNKQAEAIAARSPASVSSNKIEEVHKVDLDGAQFKQIQNEVKKIVPQYND